MMARVAILAPMESAVNASPVGEITAAPSLRQRSASRMSAVTTTASGPAAAAIQSSAASNPSSTRWNATSAGVRSHWLATTVTGTLCRRATRYASSRTGQASPSINRRALTV